jgi:hypothetical protein
MNKQEYWKKRVAKDSILEHPEAHITMTVAKFQLLLFEAFDKGYEQNAKNTKNLNDLLGMNFFGENK